jgi:hypothetical protein
MEAPDAEFKMLQPAIKTPEYPKSEMIPFPPEFRTVR